MQVKKVMRLAVVLALLGSCPTIAAAMPQAEQEAQQYRDRLTKLQDATLATLAQRIGRLEERAAGPGIPAEIVTETKALRLDFDALRRERDDHAFAIRAHLLDERVAMVESAFGEDGGSAHHARRAEYYDPSTLEPSRRPG